MEDENQHLDSDSSSSSDDDNSSAEAKQPVYYSDYEDYKNAEWSNYDYCSESSEDESSSQAATSKNNEAEESKKSLPRLSEWHLTKCFEISGNVFFAFF